MILARRMLHDLLKWDLEMHLRSQFRGFSLEDLPNERIVKLGGAGVPKNAINIIDYVIDYCKNLDNNRSTLQRTIPSYRNKEKILRKKMVRMGLIRWFLDTD